MLCLNGSLCHLSSATIVTSSGKIAKANEIYFRVTNGFFARVICALRMSAIKDEAKSM